MICLRLQRSIEFRRSLSTKKFSFKESKSTNPLLGESKKKVSIHPTFPVRTRFAPSPTGYLHLGSLRTALYNYLLAKNTGGQFILRLEDTDQKRLIDDAESNIYDTLKWCGIKIDEGPNEGGEYGPYRQSDRMAIYQKYVEALLKSGDAYYCYCSKDRLNTLRETASQLKPPTTVTYDRKCFHDHKEAEKMERVIRFKSPDRYEPFTDLIHGQLNLQPQYNNSDRRYDDFVIMKSDGLPTYHFANVVDDHLMKITHVIRGEEWLPATPKHIALYRAFGWEPPKFIHIPLLTSLEDKKLSKRSGDIGILSMKQKGILPEAVVNFCALFGWSPPRLISGISTSELMTLKDLIEKFSLDYLTKGNAKVNDSKLHFFNKNHLTNRLKDPQMLDELVDEYYPEFQQSTNSSYDKEYLKNILKLIGSNLNSLSELGRMHSYLFNGIDHSKVDQSNIPLQSKDILQILLNLPNDHSFASNVDTVLQQIPGIKKKDVFQAVRFAISGGVPGLTIPLLIEAIGEKEYKSRLQNAIKYL